MMRLLLTRGCGRLPSETAMHTQLADFLIEVRFCQLHAEHSIVSSYYCTVLIGCLNGRVLSSGAQLLFLMLRQEFI